MKQYDAIIIGFGKGGKLLAAELAERNWKVAIVERSPQMYGGTCVNVGCIPTKALIHESEYAEKRYYDDYKNQSKLYALAVARKDKLVSFLREKNYENVKNKPNITLYDGTASFLSENTIRIVSGKDETILEGKEIFINTGSTPILPAIDGLKESKYVYTSETLLQSNKLPAHLLVIGGGAVGLEFATMYAGFGSHVTLLEAGNRFLPKVDRDIAASMLEALNRKRINVRLNARVQSVYDTAEGITLTYTDSANGTPYYLKGDALLVAIGRKANTASLDLEAGGIRNDRGRILVNDRMQTNVPGVYAIGDCVFGKAQLAHTASAMGEVAAENIMGHDSTYDESTNPTCVYMEPEAASVGLTEEQCKAKGLDYKVGKFPMSANGKALIINGGEGLVKIISDAKYGEVLGMHIIGPRATDLISEGALAIRLEATVDELISTIHSHPTVTETIREAALNAMGRAIHTKNRTEADYGRCYARTGQGRGRSQQSGLPR